MQAGSPFRPDIEGLRAIAVLSVVLYHFDVPGFGSGFIGVDIFFVISGFLITGLLVREAQRTQRIDLLRFWGRRSARLLPNALLTLAVTFGCVMTLAPVLTREASGRDFAAALLYFANFHFAARALDYFDQGQQASPILHFWSLSVEEQFYGVWPICIALGLMVFKRFNRLSTLLFLFVVTTTSLWAMVHWAKYQPSRSFFDTEARVWQLATGAMLAVWLSGPTPRRQGSAAIGWFGLAGIFLSIAFLGQLPLNPRIASIAPTIATAAALYGGSANNTYATNIALGNAAMQWIGRRSYSLYLWHWPLLLFAAPLVGRTFAIVLIFIVASAAFRWVEQPIRILAPIRLVPWKLVAAGAAICCGTAAMAIVVPKMDPAYASARGAILKRLIDAKNDGPRKVGPRCGSADDADNGICVFGKPGGTKRIALYGDSHADQLFDGMDAAASMAGWEFRQWVRGGCTPIDFENDDAGCTQFHSTVYDRIAAYRPDLIVVTSANAGSVHLHEANTGRPFGRERSQAIWKAGFGRVLDRLRGMGGQVVVVRDTPTPIKSMGSICLETREPTDCATPRSDAFPDGTPDIDVAFTSPAIGLLDLSDEFCDGKSCPAMKDGLIVYRIDDHHITATMSLRLAPRFVGLLKSLP